MGTIKNVIPIIKEIAENTQEILKTVKKPTPNNSVTLGMTHNFSKESLYPYLIYNKPIPYSKNITLYPITMEFFLDFQVLIQSLTIRKDSTFPDKKIVKMTYLDFIKFCHDNFEFAEQYKMPFLIDCYRYLFLLLRLVCKTEIQINPDNNNFVINGQEITDAIFNDIRRIIIIQNNVDFDMDEFIHYDTEQALKIAELKNNSGNKIQSSIEDYIDSLIISLNLSEQDVMNMSIRKFWRYVERLNLHEDYVIRRTGECSGMVKFKDPIKHWMTALQNQEKYKNLKTSKSELSQKIG